MSKPDDKKKERVLHARISETLDHELKERATELGVSVSNLVRNVLLNSFGLVNSVVKDSANVARSTRSTLGGEPVRPQATAEQGAPPSIIGWQKLTLNVNALCTSCNAILPRGTEAAVAVLDRPAATLDPSTILCQTCLKELNNDDPD